jgi:hypothetical protein
MVHQAGPGMRSRSSSCTPAQACARRLRPQPQPCPDLKSPIAWQKTALVVLKMPSPRETRQPHKVLSRGRRPYCACSQVTPILQSVARWPVACKATGSRLAGAEPAACAPLTAALGRPEHGCRVSLRLY